MPSPCCCCCCCSVLSRESWWPAAPSPCSPPAPSHPWGKQELLSNAKLVFGFFMLWVPSPFSVSDSFSEDIGYRGTSPSGYSPPLMTSTIPAPSWGSPVSKGSNFPPDSSERLKLTPQHAGPRHCPRAPGGTPPVPPASAGQGSCSSLCSSPPSQRCLCRAGRLPARRGQAEKGLF